MCLSGCAGDGAVAGAWERGDAAACAAAIARPPARRLRSRPLPGRAAAALLAPRPRPQPLARRPRRAARRRPVWRPATSTPTPAAAPISRTPSSRCGWGRRWRRREPRRRGNSLLGAGLAGRDGEALRRAPRGGRRDPVPRRAAPLRPDRRPRLPLPRRRGPRRRPRAGARSAGRCWPSATRARRCRAEAERPARGGAGGRSRKRGLSGFFLLHRDLLELAREVALEVRGPASARAVCRPAAGRGSSVSSIVCFLTGLSHIDPVEGGPLLRPLPQRRKSTRTPLPPTSTSTSPATSARC